jgi:hypothetical protein
MTAEGGENVNEARRIDLRLVLAVVFVLAAIWAATALAEGPQQASGDAGAGNSPTLVYVQDEGDGGTQGGGTSPSGDNCPERGGGSGGSGGSGDGSPDV